MEVLLNPITTIEKPFILAFGNQTINKSMRLQRGSITVENYLITKAVSPKDNPLVEEELISPEADCN